MLNLHIYLNCMLTLRQCPLHNIYMYHNVYCPRFSGLYGWAFKPTSGLLHMTFLCWISVGQGLIALAVGAGGGGLDIFSLIYHFSFLSPSLWETARYRLKYCLKGPLNPKSINQSINSMLVGSLPLSHSHCGEEIEGKSTME